MSSILENLGDRVSKLRKEKDWSQEKLATLLNTNRNKISAIEAGKDDVGLVLIEAMSTVFDVKIAYLLGLEATTINIASGNADKFINQGSNNTLNINIPPELIDEIKKMFGGKS
ncbi:MAG: helix-turn-helix domain-containing protein [Chitinophagales bacterium]|jgi:transcriptional regulator with XRE-family HTH domain|nr:helix-turn-helix transcriptional regulator [Sphingobacteriales bacterium]